MTPAAPEPLPPGPVPLWREAVEAALGRIPARWSELYVQLPVPAPRLDPARLAEVAPPGPLAFWEPPGQGTVVALGSAAEVSGHGGSRFRDLQRALAACPALRITERGTEPAPWLGGAAFAPAHASGELGDAWFFLPSLAYELTATGASWWVTVPRALARRSRAVDAVLTALGAAERLQAKATTRSGAHGATVRRTAGLSMEAWQQRVETHRKAVLSGTLEKGVAARHLDLVLDREPPLSQVLDGLCGEGGARVLIRRQRVSFVAATPELLLKSDGEHVETEALAGTACGSEPDQELALLASAKDRSEHLPVVRALRDELEAVAVLEPIREPMVRRLRHLAHLCTPLRGRLLRPLHLLELADRLHPSPAVAGWPRDAALMTIDATEQEPRGWYAGLVGTVTGAGNGELWVGLRSAVLDGTTARLWAGAGVVGASQAEAEWLETSRKLRTLAGVWSLVP